MYNRPITHRQQAIPAHNTHLGALDFQNEDATDRLTHYVTARGEEYLRAKNAVNEVTQREFVYPRRNHCR